jgi:hypothetical protein
MAADPVSIRSEFDIFVKKPIQSSILETTEGANKPIAPIDQSDLEFVIPSETTHTLIWTLSYMFEVK